MARRKKADDIAIFYIIAFAIALSAFAIVTPLLLLAWWLSSEAKNMSLMFRGAGDPSPEEERLLELCKIQIEDNSSQISSFERAGLGLMKRTDGMFDGRDTLGRELNSRIREVQSFQDAVFREKADTENQISERIENWAAVRAQTIGLRWSLIAYLLVAYFTFSSRPDWLQPIGRLAGFYLDEKNVAGQMVIEASLVGAIAALCVMFIFRRGYHSRLLSLKRRKLQLS